MKPLWRSTLFHEATFGSLGSPGMSCHKIGSLTRGGGGDIPSSWTDQGLGAGHNCVSQDGVGIFSRIPPRCYGSALNGHGGKTHTPAWPLGHNWAETGLNALGLGTKRHRYWWRCVALIASTDTLTWGPSEVGIATDPNGISFGSVTGVAWRIGQRTGDGSMFPNKEDGWGLQWRYARSSPTDPLDPPSGFYGPSTRLTLTFVYLDSAVPALRCYVGRGVAGSWSGLAFQEPSGHGNSVYGPYLTGRILSWGHKFKVDELEDTEDPWADILRVG